MKMVATHNGGWVHAVVYLQTQNAELLKALDDALETMALAGMHDDLTYQKCKAVYLANKGE